MVRLARVLAVVVGVAMAAAMASSCSGGGPKVLTADVAIQRLDADFAVTKLSAGTERYYEQLYGPAFGADHTRLVTLKPGGPVLVLSVRHGYEASDLPALVEQAHRTNENADVLVGHGVAVVFIGGADPAIVKQVTSALAEGD